MKRLPVFLSGLILLAASCSKIELQEKGVPFRFEDYQFVIHATTGPQTKLTTSGQWKDGDEIWIAVDGRESDVYRLEYSEESNRFTIHTVSGATNEGFGSSGSAVALHAGSATLGFKNGKFCGSVQGDIVYTREGTYSKEGNTVTFNLHLATRDISLVKVSGAERSGRIRNLAYPGKLTSLKDLAWDSEATGYSAKYDQQADINYCYGILPADRMLQFQYDNEGEQAWYRVAPAKDLKAGDMTTIEGPAAAPSDWMIHYDFDYYTTGDIITWQTATVNIPVYIIVTGDGFDVYDLKKGGNFEKWSSYAMEKLFSIEPYKTYKEYFTVQFAPALSSERGVSIGSNKKDSYFGVAWQDATHYSSMMNATSWTRLWTFMSAIPAYNENSSRTFALMLCNSDTYAGLCYWSNHLALVSMALNSTWTSPRSMAWSGRWDTSSPQSSGDFANIVAHELGGHAIGYLTDEYPNSSFDRSSINSNQLSGFGNNVSLEAVHTPWESFTTAIETAGGYATGNAGLGRYLCKNDVYRSDFQGCMADNRLVWGVWNRYLIAKRIHELAEESYDYDAFIKEVPKQVTDPTWKVSRRMGVSQGGLIDHSVCTPVPPGAPPVGEPVSDR